MYGVGAAGLGATWTDVCMHESVALHDRGMHCVGDFGICFWGRMSVIGTRAAISMGCKSHDSAAVIPSAPVFSIAGCAPDGSSYTCCGTSTYTCGGVLYAFNGTCMAACPANTTSVINGGGRFCVGE